MINLKKAIARYLIITSAVSTALILRDICYYNYMAQGITWTIINN